MDILRGFHIPDIIETSAVTDVVHIVHHITLLVDVQTTHKSGQGIGVHQGLCTIEVGLVSEIIQFGHYYLVLVAYIGKTT